MVLNRTSAATDPSTASNRKELESRSGPPVLAEVAWQSDRFDADVDWMGLAR